MSDSIEPRCSFKADAIVSTSGGGYRRISNVQCGDIPDHHGEHHFHAGGELIYGHSWERGRAVARR